MICHNLIQRFWYKRKTFDCLLTVAISLIDEENLSIFVTVFREIIFFFVTKFQIKIEKVANQRK